MTLLTEEQLKQLQFFLQNLSKNQLIWISGYISGLINTHIYKNGIVDHSTNITQSIESNQCISSNDKEKKSAQITIIFASHTGNARRIAQELYDELIKIGGSNIFLYNVKDYSYKKIINVKLLIFITSTHGNGEPPEDAIPLYKYLFSKKAPELKNMNFSVLSLGDRSYEYFAKAGKDFDERLEELGGYRLCDRLDVDTDFSLEVDTWKKKVIFSFISKQSLISISKKHNDVKSKKNASNFVSYSRESPLVAYLSHRQKITSCNSTKDVHHLEIDVKGSNICYKPGDSLGVWYENDLNLISELLKIVHLTGDELVESQGHSIILNEALQKYYELTQNHPIVLKNIASISKDKLLLSLLKNQKQLHNFIKKTPLIDMFKKISIKLTPKDLLRILRPMKPRFYSISSAQSEVGEEIHITVGAVRYKINGYLRSGGASSYLIDRLQEHDKLRIFIEPNNNFKLPKNSNISMIMIGAGTGIAPFRAFMQQRAFDQSIGKNWLFFGNLKFVDDFLYQTEWQRYVKLGILNRINTAWSRDQTHKIYVQDKLLQNSIELWNWIQSGAYVYVCGDAKYMAHDVEQTLILLTSKHGNMDVEKANDFWNNMRIQNRYQRDVY